MSATVNPEVLWAQRSSSTDETKNVVYLTITAADVPKDALKFELTPTGLSFAAKNNTYNYAVELEFFDEIVPAESKWHHSGRGVEATLRKKEIKDEFWPRLLKEKKKVQFVKTDFDKWVDEDEQEEAGEDPAADMGGMGDMDMGGMGGMGGGMGGMGGLDFSKLGAGGGMPDMSQLMSQMGGAGGAGLPELGGEEDEDDMPELEETKPSEGNAEEAEGGAKIEEVSESK